MTIDFKRDEHSVLAFYGIRSLQPVEDVLRLALGWMARVGCSPDLMGTELDKGKFVRFQKSLDKAQADGFRSVRHFQMVSLSPGARSNLDGTKCNICYQKNTETINAYLIIGFHSQTLSLRSPELRRIAESACRVTRPTYGIGFGRDFDWEPIFYAMGISSVHDTDEEGDRISQWTEAVRYGLPELGLIRDVYPWNFLTAAHLKRAIGKETLHHWIHAAANRGALSPLTDRVFLWAVDDLNIPKVREALVEADIVFDYENKHIVPALEKFNVHGEIPPGQEVTRFFRAWVTKTPDEMKQWFRRKYGCDCFSSGGRPAT